MNTAEASPLETTSAGPAGRDRCGALNVLVLSSTFPSKVHPIHGVFVKERVKHVSRLPGVAVRVVSPVPYFPPLKLFSRWYVYSQVPRQETIDGLQATRPRYVLLPKVGGYFGSQAITPAYRRSIAALRDDFDFDLIDSHFIYPDGAAAARLARELDKPLVITCRGEDILRFPDLPFCGKEIKFALGQADRLVALSDEIAEAIERCGGDQRKIEVIPNGVDCEKFHPVDTQEARRSLNLPLDRPIIVSAGYRLERKGFHILIEAIPRIRERFPDVLVVIVGGPARWGQDYSGEIQRQIAVSGVDDHVLLAGPQPHEELHRWCSAADLFALFTSREGSPNVLMEALACGVPAVATTVGGIPEILSDPQLGLLMQERTASCGADRIVEALSKTWDRQAIRRHMQKHGWDKTAGAVRRVFDEAIADHRAGRHRA